jgi:ubiquinone/menaquinone biosynthesis C-methylase UbiE
MLEGVKLQEIIQHENKAWNDIFKKELENDKQGEMYSSFWWQDYYDCITRVVNDLLLKNNLNKILEAGSGSGKASLLLEKHIHKTLLDVSPKALEYAKHLAVKFHAENVAYVQGDIFSIPAERNSFDFVWNIGVVEHYEIDEIKSIMGEMVRVTKPGGIVVFGVPNFYSGPTLKAWLLKSKLFKALPGYRLETEHFYKESLLKKFLTEAVIGDGRTVEWLRVKRFGNPLPMETPKLILQTLGKMLAFVFPKSRFLTLIICKLK